jgi:sec-independent protein translocase protein TatA
MSHLSPGDAPGLEGVMGSFSLWHWLVVLLVVLLLFGSGKVSNLMGDFAKGIKSFKKNMAEDHDASMEAAAEKPAGSIAPPGAQASANQTTAARQS